MQKRWGIAAIALIMAAVEVWIMLPRNEQQSDGYRIAAIIPEKSEFFWSGVWSGVEEAAESSQIRLSEYAYPSGGDETVVQSRLERAILSEVEGILLCSNKYSDDRTKELLQQARDNNIKIVLCDSDTENVLRDGFVGVDNEQAGRQAAGILLEELQVTDIIFLHRGEANTSIPVWERKQGFLNEINGQLSVEEIQLSIVEQTEYQELQTILTNLEPDDALVCTHASDTLLIAQAIDRLGIKNEVLLLGFGESEDALAYAENGVIDILFTQDNVELGKEGLDMLRAILQGTEKESSVRKLDMKIIKNENG